MEIIYNNERYISVDEVLEKLQIKEYKLNEKVKNGEIPSPFKPDFRAFWKKSDVDKYLQEHKHD